MAIAAILAWIVIILCILKKTRHFARTVIGGYIRICILGAVFGYVLQSVDFGIHSLFGIDFMINGKTLIENFADNNLFYSILYLIKNIFIIDVGLFAASIADSIITSFPFVKRTWIPFRLPVFITGIIMLIQLQTRKQTFYCSICQKNMDSSEIMGICNSCSKEIDIKFINVTGVTCCRCNGQLKEGEKCNNRFSRINPYSRTTLAKRRIVCKNCHTSLGKSDVMNLLLYSDSTDIVSAFRETFVCNAFDINKPNSIGANFQEANQFEKISAYYKGIPWAVANGLPLKEMVVQLKTRKVECNETNYRFRIALANNPEYRLILSEGIFLLIDGKYNSIQKQDLIDSFLLDISQINTSNSIWKKPVLIGICANGVPELESRIDDKFSSADEIETYCINYLNENGNSELIFSLNNSISNFHFFLYRTGSEREDTEEKVFNVVQPVYSIMQNEQKKLRDVWTPDENGYYPNWTK